MINFDNMEEGLYRFVLTAVSPCPVIWLDQNAPRPGRPYVAIRYSAFGRDGDDVSNGKASSLGVVKMTGNRQFTFSVQAYGVAARPICESVNTAIQKESVKQFLRNYGIIFVQNLSPVQNVSEVVDADFEERAAVDFLFRIAQTYEDSVGAIDSATIKPTFEDAVGSIVENQSFIVSQT